MLIVSAGMQKSGSAWIYNIINDILIYSGKSDARQIKEIFGLKNIMKWRNNNIEELTFRKIITLVFFAIIKSSFCVKTHSGPTNISRLLLRLGFIKIIYIYRDPRDVVLSAIEHGKKILKEGENHTFARMVDFEDAVKNVQKYLSVFELYHNEKRVLLIKYEDLVQYPTKSLLSVCKYLSLQFEESNLMEIYLKYDHNQENAKLKGMHFNQGKINRYKSVFSASQVEIMNERFMDKISLMGYEFES